MSNYFHIPMHFNWWEFSKRWISQIVETNVHRCASFLGCWRILESVLAFHQIVIAQISLHTSQTHMHSQSKSTNTYTCIFPLSISLCLFLHCFQHKQCVNACRCQCLIQRTALDVCVHLCSGRWELWVLKKPPCVFVHVCVLDRVCLSPDSHTPRFI